jgi:hypothetical protein
MSSPISPPATAPPERTVAVAPTGTRLDGLPAPLIQDVPPAARPPADLQRIELPSVDVTGPAPLDEAIETPLVSGPFPPRISGPEPVSAADRGPGTTGSRPGTVQRSTSLPGALPDRSTPDAVSDRPPSGAPMQAVFHGGRPESSFPDLPLSGSPVGPIGLRPLQRVGDIAGSPPLAGPPGSTPGSTSEAPLRATTVDAGTGWPQGAPAQRSAGRPVQLTADGRTHGTPSVRGPSPAVQALFGAPLLPQLPQMPAPSMTAPDPVAATGESPMDAVPARALDSALEQLPAAPDVPTALPPVVPGLPGVPGVPAAPAAGTAPPPGGAPADLDALVRRLYDPLARRLKAELRLDRERVGRALDLRH